MLDIRGAAPSPRRTPPAPPRKSPAPLPPPPPMMAIPRGRNSHELAIINNLRVLEQRQGRDFTHLQGKQARLRDEVLYLHGVIRTGVALVAIILLLCAIVTAKVVFGL